MNTEISYSVEYDEPGPDSEYSVQPRVTIGLAGFLALALALDIPVLSDDVSHERWGQSTLGRGTSFLVSRSFLLQSHGGTRYLDPNATIDGKPGGVGDRLEACKSLVSKRICRQTRDDNDHECLEAMIKEMRILGHGTLRDHENIVRMVCIDWSGDCADPVGSRCWPSLILECASQGTLGEYLKRGTHSWDTKWYHFLGISEGLQFLHDHLVAHCDLKPENILVCGESQNAVVKITDFGFAVVMSDYDEDAVLTWMAGTPPWNAPELTVSSGRKVRDLHKADIYTMGLLFAVIALQGNTPWEVSSVCSFQELKAKNDDALMHEFLHCTLSDAIAEQAHRIDDVLNVTIKTDPANRHSAADLAQLLRRLFLDHLKLVRRSPLHLPQLTSPTAAPTQTAARARGKQLGSDDEPILPQYLSHRYHSKDAETPAVTRKPSSP